MRLIGRGESVDDAQHQPIADPPDRAGIFTCMDDQKLGGAEGRDGVHQGLCGLRPRTYPGCIYRPGSSRTGILQAGQQFFRHIFDLRQLDTEDRPAHRIIGEESRAVGLHLAVEADAGLHVANHIIRIGNQIVILENILQLVLERPDR